MNTKFKFVVHQILNKENIKIEGAFCTEICCDSDFAEKLIRLLPKMTDYYGKGKKLYLEGEGEVILRQI